MTLDMKNAHQKTSNQHDPKRNFYGDLNQTSNLLILSKP